MQLLFMLVVCLAFIPLEPSGPIADPHSRVAITWLGVLVVSAFAELTSWWLTRRLRNPDNRRQTLRLYGIARLVHVVATLGWFIFALFDLEWGAVIRYTYGLERYLLIDEIVVLSPYLVAVALGWLSYYRVERAIVNATSSSGALAFWGRWSYLWFHCRHYLGLVLAPTLLFKGIQELLYWSMPDTSTEPWFQVLMAIGLTLALLLITPWLLTKIWSAHSLPTGPLRDRLEATARRLKFGYTDIVLWNTRGGMANALVTGVFRYPRYVLLSDGLLQGLTEDEVEAVFGHEIGHVKHQHMPLYLGFIMLSFICLWMLGSLVLPAIPEEATEWLAFAANWKQSAEVWGSYLAGVAVLGGYVYFVFGFLSRRCERQADVYGCKVVSCHNPHCSDHWDGRGPVGKGLGLCPTGIRTFIQALEKVADLNGIRRDKYSWRHASIARRVAFLEKLLQDPAHEQHFQRRLGLVKCALFVALCGLFGVLIFCGADWVAALTNV